MTSHAAKVPGKINLHLGVGPLQPDGFHELVTVFQAISIYDEVTANTAPPGTISLATPLPGVADQNNLAIQAAELLHEQSQPGQGVSLSIKKGIPVAGGMAGGSADAAGALRACAELWQTDVELSRLAAQLGSDIPFALRGGTALGRHRGEDLTEVPCPAQFHWVLATFTEGLSTPSVYGRFDDLGLGNTANLTMPTELLSAIAAGDPHALGRSLHNDLQPAAIALRPVLQDVLDIGLFAGALGAVVSGSGPTCAFLVATVDAGLPVAVALAASGLCSATRSGTSPAEVSLKSD